MISISDVIVGIGRAIASCGQYQILREEPRQTETPLVYVKLVSCHENNASGTRAAYRVMLIDLMLVGSTAEVTNNEYYTFASRMDAALRPTIHFAGRYIEPKAIMHFKANGMGHYQFELQFYDKLQTQEQFDGTTDVMDELILQEVIN